MSRIILCTDGSDLATHAARTGTEVLSRADELVIATVVDAPDEAALVGESGFAGPTMTESEFDEHERQMLNEGEEVVTSVARALRIDGARTAVLRGDPGPALCTLARDLKASVLVVGTRGRGGLKRAILGSVSDHVVRNAPCPVLVVGGESAANDEGQT